jgi:hypothetical protein
VEIHKLCTFVISHSPTSPNLPSSAVSCLSIAANLSTTWLLRPVRPPVKVQRVKMVRTSRTLPTLTCCGLLVASSTTVLPAQSASHRSSAQHQAAPAPVRPPGCPAPASIARAVSPGDVVLGPLDHADDARRAPASIARTVFYTGASRFAASDTGAHAGPSAPRITVARPATVKTRASGDVTPTTPPHSTGRSLARSTAKRPALRRVRPWTVQVASYETLDEAQALQATLCGRGYEARIVGAVRPYDVRVGRYPTSQAAMAVARRLTSRQLTVFVAPAE